MNNVNTVGEVTKLRHNKEAEFTSKSNNLPIQAISISLSKSLFVLNRINLKQNNMKEIITKIAEDLIEVRKLQEELGNKEYWIQKAAQETNFIPAEGDWIHVEITLFKIEVSVHHKDYGGTKYWKNGHWFNDPFDSNYPLHEKMLAEMRAW